MDPCSGCDAGCCSRFFVPLTCRDVKALMGCGLPLADAVGWIEVGSVFCSFPDVRLGDGYCYMVLKRREDGLCVLASSQEGGFRCGLHGKHPLLCRLYPRTLHGELCRSNLCRNVQPPADASLLESGLKALGEYEDKVARWNTSKRAGRLPEDFIRFLLA